MWIITDDGFLSIVQHNADPSLLRVRARRLEHLAAAFPGSRVVTFEDDEADYAFHADVPRADVAAYAARKVTDLAYTGHVKEAVAAADPDFYRAMLGCWHALYQLQVPA